ncbi:olfactory receptor 10AG1-like [Sarcophilus harrisii]|uniref:olfactory receptor 10AG1-like n=1 Tax=Sarcophilus harrisii TaxID=9305 RepID=UPI00062B3E89|nr:olfactory receptor 10AG1-like [Sarcophilus harrisii]
MSGENYTIVMEFILLGFSVIPKLQGFIFAVFLIMYMNILVGNGLIIAVTKTDAALQTPMYFFLGNFSFLEICYTSVIFPKLLTNFWSHNKNISFLACAIQLGFFLVLGSTECLLVAVMSYDHYVAICKPLNYPLIMNHKFCVQLVVVSWISGIPVQTTLTYLVSSLPFCGSNKLNHVLCDIPPLLKLACGDTSTTELSVYIVAVLFGMISFLLILWSYIKIITVILKLPSATSRYKAFSTCFSHLILVSLFYGSIAIMYLRPKASHSEEIDKVLSLFYTILTPMFNPMIYSLRNKDVITALRKLLLK